MKILVTNDDGYFTPGIAILYEQLTKNGHKVIVVAPEQEHSGKSLAMTFDTMLYLKQQKADIFSLSGTPGDCVAIALHEVLAKSPPDLVISGINDGWNVGRDINYSGTVGAATEAALEGYRSIAVSAKRSKTPAELLTIMNYATDFICRILSKIELIEWPRLHVLNVNIPSASPLGINVCQCHSKTTTHKLELLKGELPDSFLQSGEIVSSQDKTQDIYSVQQNYISMSFLDCRHCNQVENNKLEIFCQKLKP